MKGYYLIGNSEGEKASDLSSNGEQQDFNRVVDVLSPVKIIGEKSLFLLILNWEESKKPFCHSHAPLGSDLKEN